MSRRNVWINNSRVGRYLAEILGNQAERLNFAISKLISVVVPIDLIAYEDQTIPFSIAGNTSVTIRPFRGHRLKLLYGKITLVTDATVANRYIQFTVTNSAGTEICGLGQSAAIAASLTRNYNIAPIGLLSTWTAVSDGLLGFTQDLEVFAEDGLKIAVAAGVAGDVVSGYLKVRWL